MKRKSMSGLAVLLVLAVVLCQSKVHAVENTAASTESAATSAENTVGSMKNATIPAENVTVPTESNEIISVILPVVEERDPFSFFIDPLHIFYNTFGNSGGDITVEEDTCLLFYNRDEGGYTLSSQSDSLTIINKSTVPVEVTITAKLENVDGISVMREGVFEDREACDLYLALVDNEGNEQPLSEEGEITVTVKLDRAPLDAYAYVLDEATGEYQYVCRSGDVAFETYSFGLKGACNEKGDWTNISGNPHVTISWNVEPVIPEKTEDEKASGSISGNVVPDDDASDADVPDQDEESTGEQAADSDEDPTENEAMETGSSVSKNAISAGKETMADGDSDYDSNGAGREKSPVTADLRTN